jgi:hypothetical protein
MVSERQDAATEMQRARTEQAFQIKEPLQNPRIAPRVIPLIITLLIAVIIIAALYFLPR